MKDHTTNTSHTLVGVVPVGVALGVGEEVCI